MTAGYRILFFVHCLAPFLAAFLFAPVVQAQDPGKLGPGDHVLKLAHGGLDRKALVHVPPGYDPARPMPLVLAFHGGGGHAEFMADDQRYGLGPKADAAGFVVVYPNGTSKFPGGRFAAWNAGACCGDARDRNVDDVGFARAVVAAVAQRLSIDSRRVFATGMSNGAMMSHRLACEAPDLFKAVAAVAGTDVTTTCSPAAPVSVLQVHARDDDHVQFGGGAGPASVRDRSKITDFTSVPDTVSRWLKRNRCEPAPQRVLDRAGATCDAYTSCAGGVTVQLCVTQEGGHSWPGAAAVRRGKEAASQALSANDVMWDFFQAAGR